MHDHCCNHNLKHCPVCDVVYCDKCKKEWGQNKATPWWIYIPQTYYPYTITATSTDNVTGTSVVQDDTHIHG